MKPPLSRTHDISSVNFHVRDLETFGQTLSCATAAAFPNETSGRSRYDEAHVLFLSWMDDLLEVSKEIAELRDVFRKRYHYNTEEWHIPSNRSHNALVKHMSDFLVAHEDRKTLLIVYYAGHGRLNDDRQLVGACHDTPDSPTIQWLGIQNMLEQAESDVLILLDCCAAASSAAEAGNGVTEVIAACGFETWAPGVSEHSFTRSLIEELQFWCDKPSNTVAMLHMRVLATMKHWKPRPGGTRVGERRKTPIHTVLGNQGHPRSIQLIPLLIEHPPLAEMPALPTERPCSESSGPETGSPGASDGNNLDSSQSSTSHLSSVPDFRPPKVLISLALEEDQWLSPNAWAEWLESVPAKVKSACVEGVYRSYSTLVLLSIPVATWDMLPDNPAVNFIGFVISDNLLQDAPLGGLLRQCSTVGSIQRNVSEQKYDSLADFKSDHSILSRDLATTSAIVGDRQIKSIYNDELEKAISAFPAFTNFDHTAFKRGTTAILTSNSSEQLQGHMEGLSEQKDDTATSNAISFDTRVPYWSLPEEKKFPELLQRYGRDFARIADHLKTKTPEDVGQHFYLLTNGNTKFSDLAALADARLQRKARSIGTTTDSRDAKFEIRAPDDPAHGNSHYLFHPISTSTAGPPYPHFEIPKKSLASLQGATKNAETNLEPGEKMEGPVRKKRRPPPRVLCPDCPDHKDGFRDEYALKKHTARFHRATRKVWICEDISIDKRFLTKCKSCSASKRYSSGNNAGKHLRKEHFNAETSAETLQRWIRETEEPNPNMKMPSADSASTTRRIRKAQSTGGRAISLPPLKPHLDSPRTLPSTIFETDGQKPLSSMSRTRSSSSLDDSVDEVEETDARDISLSSPEAKSSNNEVFLEDISFDNLLSGNPSEPRLLSDEGSSHLINRALIKPDQVLRLPNLDPFRKAACLDQVEALYHRLDNALTGSLYHKEALEDLTSLSRLLMRNLRDWRRHSTLAPHIPFSI